MHLLLRHPVSAGGGPGPFPPPARAGEGGPAAGGLPTPLGRPPGSLRCRGGGEASGCAGCGASSSGCRAGRSLSVPLCCWGSHVAGEQAGGWPREGTAGRGRRFSLGLLAKIPRRSPAPGDGGCQRGVCVRGPGSSSRPESILQLPRGGVFLHVWLRGAPPPPGNHRGRS